MKSLTIATWNVNSIRKRSENVANWLDKNQVDVVCFQETKVMDELFPAGIFDECNYEVVYNGQKAYNGVAIASRYPIKDVVMNLDGMDEVQKRYIEATIQGVRIVSVYVPNGSNMHSDKYPYKLKFLQHLHKKLIELRQDYQQVVVGGDYNVAPTNNDVYDIDDWGHNSIAVTAPEREAYAKLLTANYVDVQRELYNDEPAFTWWDYRQGSFPKDRGLRIDHFLVAGAVAKKLTVDKIERQTNNPSDHAPVILELVIA